MTTAPLTPPPVPPCTPSVLHNDELQPQQPVQLQQPSSSSSSSSTCSSGIVCDSKHLMKPVAERLRRLSTGSMRFEVTGGGTGGGSGSPAAGVGGRIAITMANDCYIGNSSGFIGSGNTQSGFRKCQYPILDFSSLCKFQTRPLLTTQKTVINCCSTCQSFWLLAVQFSPRTQLSSI